MEQQQEELSIQSCCCWRSPARKSSASNTPNPQYLVWDVGRPWHRLPRVPGSVQGHAGATQDRGRCPCPWDKIVFKVPPTQPSPGFHGVILSAQLERPNLTQIFGKFKQAWMKKCVIDKEFHTDTTRIWDRWTRAFLSSKSLTL